jgi:hypothetical protein
VILFNSKKTFFYQKTTRCSFCRNAAIIVPPGSVRHRNDSEKKVASFVTFLCFWKLFLFYIIFSIFQEQETFRLREYPAHQHFLIVVDQLQNAEWLTLADKSSCNLWALKKRWNVFQALSKRAPEDVFIQRALEDEGIEFWTFVGRGICPKNWWHQLLWYFLSIYIFHVVFIGIRKTLCNTSTVI